MSENINRLQAVRQLKTTGKLNLKNTDKLIYKDNELCLCGYGFEGYYIQTIEVKYAWDLIKENFPRKESG